MDLTTTNMLYELEAPKLQSNDYAKDLEELIANINHNFKILCQSDFYKGPAGDSTILKSLDITEKLGDKSIKEILQDALVKEFENIDKEIEINNTKYSAFEGLKGSINLIYEKNLSNNSESLISSMPYVFLDGRFNNNTLHTEGDEFSNIEDCSCIIQYSDGEFKIIKTFPTLYYDKSFQNFCWKLNGVKTGLIARGPQGYEGKNGKINIIKASPLENATENNKIYEASEVLTQNGWISLYNKDGKPNDKVIKESNIFDGSSVFVALPNDLNTKYYISLIYFDKTLGKYCVYLNDTDIYNAFLGHNFIDLLSNIDINNDNIKNVKGLFVPIENSLNLPSHSLIATSNIQNDGKKSTFNICPTNINNIKDGDIVNVFKISVSYYIDGNENTEEFEYYKKVKFSDLKSNLLNLEHYNDIKDLLNSEDSVYIYIFKNVGKAQIYTKSLNIQNNDELIYENPSSIITCKCKNFTKNIAFKNANQLIDNCELNIHYSNINVGVNNDSSFNISGTAHANNINVSNGISSENANINTLDCNEINSNEINGSLLHIDDIDVKDKICSDRISTNEIDVNNVINSNVLLSNDISSRNIYSNLILSSGFRNDGDFTIAPNKITNVIESGLPKGTSEYGEKTKEYNGWIAVHRGSDEWKKSINVSLGDRIILSRNCDPSEVFKDCNMFDEVIINDVYFYFKYDLRTSGGLRKPIVTASVSYQLVYIDDYNEEHTLDGTAKYSEEVWADNLKKNVETKYIRIKISFPKLTNVKKIELKLYDIKFKGERGENKGGNFRNLKITHYSDSKCTNTSNDIITKVENSNSVYLSNGLDEGKIIYKLKGTSSKNEDLKHYLCKDGYIMAANRDRYLKIFYNTDKEFTGWAIEFKDDSSSNPGARRIRFDALYNLLNTKA